MGIVKKQAYSNTIVSYLGYIIGYVNLIILYPKFLTTEEIGLFQLLTSIAIFFSLFSTLGAPGIIIRFFPYYKTEDKRHQGFLHWIGLVSLGGFVFCTLLFFVLKPVIAASFIEKSPLFVDYYYYVIPLGFFMVFFNFFEAVGKVAYQTIYSSFLREILLRLLTTVAVVFYVLELISFDQFIMIYVALNGFTSILLLISISYSGKFSTKIPEHGFEKIENKKVINYGRYTLLAGIVYVLLQKVDILMLSSMTGLSEQGVYSTFFTIATIISVPAQALSRTTYQLVSDAWKNNDLENVKNIYYKTSIIQMTIGSLLFIGVIINKDNLLEMLKKPDFALQFNVFVLIGFSFLVDITGGLNTHIISVSDRYRLTTVVTVISSLCCVVLNYFFIPILGGIGAALSYMLTVTGINFYNWLFIKRNFNMQPFTSKHVLVIVMSTICFVVGYYFWRIPSLYFDIFVRSSVVAILFAAMTYYFKISPDINEKVDDVFKKITKK